MTTFRIKLFFLMCLTTSTILWGRASFSETTISEQTLTGDIIIEDMYQPGNGLPVGKIQSVRGDAFVFHRNPTVGYRIHSGLPLYAGDVMHTRETAWLLCRFIDGSHIVLTPNTILTIHQSSYNSSRKIGVTSLHLEHGSARFKLKPMPDLLSYDYKVQTEVALTRAREGDFFVHANPEATEIVAFENSRLEVTSMAQPEEVTYLSDFQRTSVSKTILSPTVETLSKEDIEAMKTDIHRALSGTLAAAAKKDESPDPKSEDTLIEEDIVED